MQQSTSSRQKTYLTINLYGDSEKTTLVTLICPLCCSIMLFMVRFLFVCLHGF